MACPPYYYLSESCLPALTKEVYSPVYSEGEFSGRVIYLNMPREEKMKPEKREEYKESAEKFLKSIVEKGFNVQITEYLFPKSFFYNSFFKGVISEAGGRLSHAAILAREKGIPFAILPNATKLFFQGDYVNVKAEEIFRRESDFFSTATLYPDNYSFLNFSDYYHALSRKVLCEIAGRKTKIIQPIERWFALDLKPSDYFSLTKRVDINKILKIVERTEGFKKALAYRLVQEVGFYFPQDKIKYYIKYDKEEDEYWKKIYFKISKQIGEARKKSRKDRKIAEKKILQKMNDDANQLIEEYEEE